MNVNLPREPDPGGRVVVERADCRQKHLGEWTTARQFAVEADRSLVVVDLLLPRLPSGDIEIDLDIDHSTVTLLVPGGAKIDDAGLRRIGRGRVKDHRGRDHGPGAGSCSRVRCAAARSACTVAASRSCRSCRVTCARCGVLTAPAVSSPS